MSVRFQPLCSFMVLLDFSLALNMFTLIPITISVRI